MNHPDYRHAKRYLQETHAQAYRDHLVRSATPSFRVRLASLLTALAARLRGDAPSQPAVSPSRG